jgi:hypothetical protein
VVSKGDKVTVDHGQHYCRYRYAISNRADVLVDPDHVEWLVTPSSQIYDTDNRLCQTHVQRSWELTSDSWPTCSLMPLPSLAETSGKSPNVVVQETAALCY